jgi:hypothetical protein
MVPFPEGSASLHLAPHQEEGYFIVSLFFILVSKTMDDIWVHKEFGSL